MSSHIPDDALRGLKVEPPARLRAEGRAAMVRFAEQQFSKEKERIGERSQRLDPVYAELEAVLRKSPEFAGVARAIDARERTHRPAEPLTASKNRFAPKRPLVRYGSIHIVDSLPFYSDTWLAQDGTSNNLWMPPTADGTTGDMGFGLDPGQTSSGFMNCFAALGATVKIPFLPVLINFTAYPSVSWSYSEASNFFRQAAGNMWAGLYVGLFDSDGTFIDAAVNTQNSVASFNDRNLVDSSHQSGSTSAMPLFAGISLGPDGQFGGALEGGFLEYWCWIGGNCNCDGTNGQSAAIIFMNANCPNLIVDMFELG
jgi:hypothetical protein